MNNDFKFLDKETCFSIACASCEVYQINSLNGCNKECPQKQLKDDYKQRMYILSFCELCSREQKVIITMKNRVGEIKEQKLKFIKIEDNEIWFLPPRKQKECLVIKLNDLHHILSIKLDK